MTQSDFSALSGSPGRFAPRDAARYRASGAWTDKTLDTHLRETVERFGDRLAVAQGRHSLTYTELEERTARLGAALISRGLQPGDAVMLQLGNEIDTVVVMLALQRVGLVPVTTLPNHGTYELTHVGGFVEAKALVVQTEFRRYDLVAQALALTEQLPTLQHVVAMGQHSTDPRVPTVDQLVAEMPLEAARRLVEETQARCHPEAAFLIHLTGGTTGLPKLIAHSSSSYLGLIRGYVDVVGLRSSDRWLYCTPIVHNAGTVTALYPALLAGAALILGNGIDTEALRDAFRTWRPSALTAQPAVARTIVDSASGVPDEDYRSLRLAGLTRNDRPLAEELSAATAATVVGMFGMSEGPLLASSPEDPLAARVETSGRVCGPDVEVRVVDLVSGEEASDGGEGELRAKGASVIPAYLGIDSTDYYDSEGFLRTGDIAVRVVHEGVPYFRIVGRMKDTISRGGEKYFAVEIERLLVALPGIREAAIVAHPDPVVGERGHAFVVLEAGSPAYDVRTVAARLADLGVAKYKWPELVTVIDDLPRTSLGAMKVDKKALSTMSQAETEPAS